MKVKDIINLIGNDHVIIDDLVGYTSEYLTKEEAENLHAEKRVLEIYSNYDDICIVVTEEV